MSTMTKTVADFSPARVEMLRSAIAAYEEVRSARVAVGDREGRLEGLRCAMDADQAENHHQAWKSKWERVRSVLDSISFDGDRHRDLVEAAMGARLEMEAIMMGLGLRLSRCGGRFYFRREDWGENSEEDCIAEAAEFLDLDRA